MIAANTEIGFRPESAWGKLNKENVHLLEIEEPLCQRDIFIDLKRNKTDSSAVEEFFAFIKKSGGRG